MDFITEFFPVWMFTILQNLYFAKYGIKQTKISRNIFASKLQVRKPWNGIFTTNKFLLWLKLAIVLSVRLTLKKILPTKNRVLLFLRRMNNMLQPTRLLIKNPV